MEAPSPELGALFLPYPRQPLSGNKQHACSAQNASPCEVVVITSYLSWALCVTGTPFRRIVCAEMSNALSCIQVGFPPILLSFLQVSPQKNGEHLYEFE